MLIAQRCYFVLHAPRQTGKTTSLLALMHHLNKEGRYRACYANIEGAQTARHDVARGLRTVCDAISCAANQYLGGRRPDGALTGLLERWSKGCDRPIVPMLDEVDASRSCDRSVLDRPSARPHSPRSADRRLSARPIMHA